MMTEYDTVCPRCLVLDVCYTFVYFVLSLVELDMSTVILLKEGIISYYQPLTMDQSEKKICKGTLTIMSVTEVLWVNIMEILYWWWWVLE